MRFRELINCVDSTVRYLKHFIEHGLSCLTHFSKLEKEENNINFRKSEVENERVIEGKESRT
jgi:hypothetical protein